MRVSAGRVQLKPHGSAVVRVSTDPPRSAAPSDYLAGVSIQALGQVPSTQTAGRSVKIADLHRYAIGVETRVPGPRHPSLAITSASVRWDPSGLTFHVRAVNTGNAILTGVRGAVSISADGHQVQRVPVGPGTFVTGSSIEIPVLAERARPSSDTKFTVHAQLRYGHHGHVATLRRTVQFGRAAAVVAHTYKPESMPGPIPENGTPWWLGPLLGVVGTLAALGLWRTLRGTRRRRALPGIALTEVGEPQP